MIKSSEKEIDKLKERIKFLEDALLKNDLIEVDVGEKYTTIGGHTILIIDRMLGNFYGIQLNDIVSNYRIFSYRKLGNPVEFLKFNQSNPEWEDCEGNKEFEKYRLIGFAE